VQSGLDIPETKVPELPAARPISEATKKSIAALQQSLAGTAQKVPRPHVLPSDVTPTPGGELARLQNIVQGPFLSGDMTGAQQKLQAFLSLPRKPELGARARFYLGQVDYFQGKARDALLEFLAAQDFFYQESAPWIDACYELLEKTGL
jgi:TolA-binding protein